MSRLPKCLLLLYLFVGAGKTAVCQNYIFAQLTGTPMNTTGWNLAGSANVTNIVGSADSELLICSTGFNNSGAAFFGQPINLSLCNKWIAEFDFRMYDGTGADGMAFCFLDVPPSGYVIGGGLGIPDSAKGLKVCFDTWNNCIPFDPTTVHQDMPKIEIRWGVGYDQVGANNTVIYGECSSYMPTLDNSNGTLSYMRGPKYNRAKIVYDSGKISIYVNDTFYLSTYQPNLFNFKGYMGFTASTGGYDDNHSIKNVIIYTQMPPSYAGGGQAFCPYDTIRLGGPANPTYTYVWSPPTGLSDSTVAAPLLHLANNTGDSALHKYYVRTAFGYNPGCASIDSVTVKVYPNPVVNFTMPKICVNDVVAQFYDSSYTLDAETLPFMYRWNFGDYDQSTLQNPSHHFAGAANYLMSLTVTNSKGCVDSATKVFTVNGADPQASFQVVNPTGLCSNGPVELDNLSTVNFGSVVAVQISWGDSAGVSYMDSMPYPGKIYAHQYPDPVTTATASYTIRMVAASGLVCQNAADQSINVLPGPHAQFAAIPKLCDIDTAVELTEGSELTGLAGHSGYSGRGVVSGVLDPLRAGPGMDKLLFIYQAVNGCADTAYQTVYIQSLPQVRASDDTAVVMGQPLQLNVRSSDGPGDDTFLWSPPDGLNDPGLANPIALLGENIDSIRYVVTVTDSIGCVGVASVKVTVFSTLPDLFVPNAFTPGRGTNNIFRPVPVGVSGLGFFKVFNRNGELVYSTSRLGDGWDGRVGGRMQEAGMYVWVAEGTAYTGKKIFKKGTVMLIR